MSIKELNKTKTPLVKIDKNLDKFKGKVLFPKKLALAEELLQRAKFPAELKEKFRKELEEAKAAAADEAVADEALRKAVENAEIVELPHEMVHDEVHRQMEHYLNDMRRNGISPEMYYQITGTTEADLHKMMEKDADVRTKTNLVLEQIVKEEGIEATDEDVANEVKELAAQYGMEEDAVRAAVSVDMLKNDIAMKKALAVITESAKEA